MSKGRGKKTKDRIDGYEPQRPADVDPWASPEVVQYVRDNAPTTGNARWDEANMDGFVNCLTGIGDWMKDKALGGRPGGPIFMVDFISHVAAEDRWRGSDLGRRLVESLPDEMTREGWDVTVQPSDEDEEPDEKEDGYHGNGYLGADMPRRDALPPSAAGESPLNGPPPAAPAPPKFPGQIEVDDESAEIIEALDGRLEELDLLNVLWEVLCYERAYGGGAILLGAQDGSDDLTKPLDEERIKDVTHLTAFSGGWDGELVAWSWYRDVTGPKYGQPEMYMLRNLGIPIAKIPAPGEPVGRDVLPPARGPGFGYGPLITWVHESRLLVFPGVAVSRRARVQMRGWGDSLFTRVDRVLQQYDQTWGGVANLMTDFSQAILSVEGFTQSLLANNRAGGLKSVTNRAMAVKLGRSIAGLLLIDSKENFRRDTASLAGLPEMLQQFALRLAAAADMPVSLLMGQAPAGLNATGDSDIRFYYDRIASKQKKRMMPQIKRLISLLFRAQEGPTEGAEPARWGAAPKPLYQLSETEKADVYLKTAQADQIYVGMQTVTPEEVAATRMAGSEFKTGSITLDLEGREEMALQAQEDAAALAKQREEMHQAQLEVLKNSAPPAEPAPKDGEQPEEGDGEKPDDEAA